MGLLESTYNIRMVSVACVKLPIDSSENDEFAKFLVSCVANFRRTLRRYFFLITVIFDVQTILLMIRQQSKFLTSYVTIIINIFRKF